MIAALLGALARFDEARGADAVYGLASDRMRASLGDRASLERGFRNERYRPLIGPGDRDVEGIERLGDSARATVVVRDAGGATVRYLVAMRRQTSGERAGTWLLSGIIRDGVDA